MKIHKYSARFVALFGIICCVLGLFQNTSFAQTAANTQITNIASVSFSDGTTTYTNQSNAVVITVAAVAGLTITPDAQNNGSVTPGQTGVTMVFRVTNTGNFSDDVVFGANGSSLRVVGGATITSAVAGSTDILTNGSAVSQSIAQNGFVDVTVTLSISAGATLGSTIQVFLGDATTGTNFDNVAADNSANEVHTVSTGATNGSREARGDISVTANASDLTVSKSHTGSFTVGSTGTYTLTATNAGNIATSGTITITDTLPTGLTVNGGTAGTVTPSGTNAANWTCSSNATSPQIITCTSSTAIAASGTSTFNFAVNVGTNTAVGTNSVTNTAVISGGGEANTTNNSTTDPTTILAPDLTIAKSHTGNFTIGSLGNYTITVGNSGTAATSGTITITDSLPTGLTVSNGTKTLGGANAANWTCIAASNVITCTSSTVIPVGGSSVFSFNVSVGSAAGTGVTNTATVSGGNEPTVNNGNNTASDPTNVVLTAFSGCDSRMFLSQGPNSTTNTSLYNVNTTTNPFTFPVIRQGSYPYNAIAFNPTDNYIYGILNNNATGNSLLRIGSDGNTVNLGVVSGLPLGDYVAADINSSGTFYVMGKTNPSILYVINIATLTATSISLSTSVDAYDIAWKGGLLYTVTPTGQLMSINPSTGSVTNIGASSGAANFGALYGAPNGLFGNNNDGLGFYQFDLVTGAKTLISASPGATVNDGAHCVDANVTFGADIAVTKTDGQTNYLAGSNIVYTITATNNGPFGAQNVTISDPLPAGITTANWTCSATGGGTCTASGTGAINDSTVDLPVGATATYTLTMTVPAGFTGNLVNTATATVGAGNTDPTPGNNSATDTDTLTTYAISGKIFEDVNYGGGEGRDIVTANGVVRPNARVELYNSSGNFVSFTTTDASGTYTFSNVAPGNYTVRVVNSTVTSSRPGYVAGLLPVQTFRTDIWGVAPFDVQRIGGEKPSLVDAGNGSTTLAALTTATTTPQSITTVIVGTENVTDIDFGYNFDTIVNTNDSGQGSLRQFINNANALSNSGLNQEANAVFDPASGEETSIFMIPTSSDIHGRPADANCLGLICSISVTSAYPQITQSVTLDGRTQQGYSGTPLIEVSGANASFLGIQFVGANDSKARGLTVNSSGANDIYFINLTNLEIAYNYLGTNVAGTAGKARPETVDGINGYDSSIINIHDNLISGNSPQSIASGIDVHGITDLVIVKNKIGTDVTGMTAVPNIQSGILINNASNVTIGGTNPADRNVVAGNSGAEVSCNICNQITILNNYIGVGADGETRLSIDANSGIQLIDTTNATIGNVGQGNVIAMASNITNAAAVLLNGTTQNVAVKGNLVGITPGGNVLTSSALGIYIISGSNNVIGGTNSGEGNKVTGMTVGIGDASGNNNVFSGNSTYNNTGLGIDLTPGYAFGVTLNDANDSDTGPNALLNFPVFESITTNNGNLTIKGCSPAGATIELFKTDISMGTAAVGANRLGKQQDYGEGQVYLTTLTEGSGSDTDSGTGCPTDVDGNNQTGMSKFSFTIPIPSGVTNGDLLTTTATISGVGTSEFSPSFPIAVGTPNLQLVKSCPSPSNCTAAPQMPGTDLTYQIDFTNIGNLGAQNLAIVDKVPDFTDFKVGTATANVGSSGLTFAIEYSSDYDSLNPTFATWNYTPASGGGGASAGYDRNVKAVRWRVTSGILSSVSPNNTGNVSFIAKIR